ncbi:fibronectin type III domain-containing protein [Phycisphaerales bacterium AB-hyl4]|uniref:Fibronectin type III domain-containing protein n=1 Tax=Natronomicrosphaera hydrolytica TaxID=3242702 RepID=A0ABV4U994_9BACT
MNIHRAIMHLTTTAALSGAVLFLSLPVLAGLPAESDVLIDFDAEWRYHDGDEDLGTAWKQPDYDDSDWSEGPALLGYAPGNRGARWPSPHLQTRLQESLITYYFRKEFEYAGRTDGVRLRLDQIIDDGAIYYLNGEEIGRSELMPDGEIGFGTEADRFTNPSVEQDVFEIDVSHLREGRNVLAVMVANHTAGSSDICLGVRLSITKDVQKPAALYLTWQRDPTTTMTIQWHTEGPDDEVMIEYGPRGGEDLSRTEGVSHPMVFSDRHIHTVELIDLEPGSNYRFRIYRSEQGQSSRFYAFRTMPAEADRPIRFAAGGDTRTRKAWMEQTNRQAVRYDLDFIVWGGDLAYADGREENLYRWYEWFEVNYNTLIDEDGRVVPIIVGIGNHEIRGGRYRGEGRGEEGYEDTDAFREDIAPYYFNLFAFPGHPGYGTLDFGDYMSIILLDTDHAGPVHGKQASWLEEELTDRQDVPHLFPVYHIPAYPSARDFSEYVSGRVRQHWVPLFEQYGIRVAFENHDHTYKRTVPIRNNEEHEDGIVYIGDGAWGVGLREVHSVEDTWYLTRAESVRHLILVTIQDQSQDYKVINEDGDLIDHYIPRPPNQ